MVLATTHENQKKPLSESSDSPGSGPGKTPLDTDKTVVRIDCSTMVSPAILSEVLGDLCTITKILVCHLKEKAYHRLYVLCATPEDAVIAYDKMPDVISITKVKKLIVSDRNLDENACFGTFVPKLHDSVEIPARPPPKTPLPVYHLITVSNDHRMWDVFNCIKSHTLEPELDHTCFRRFGKNRYLVKIPPGKSVWLCSPLLKEWNRSFKRVGIISVEPYEPFNTSMGKIYSPELCEQYDLKDIDNLMPSTVFKVISANKGKNGLVLLQFSSTIPPDSVAVEPKVYKVHSYVPSPRYCKNCNKYGHVQKKCRSAKSCIKCASTDVNHSCSSNACIFCQASHLPFTNECPEHRIQKDIASKAHIEKISFLEAERLVRGPGSRRRGRTFASAATAAKKTQPSTSSTKKSGSSHVTPGKSVASGGPVAGAVAAAKTSVVAAKTVPVATTSAAESSKGVEVAPRASSSKVPQTKSSPRKPSSRSLPRRDRSQTSVRDRAQKPKIVTKKSDSSTTSNKFESLRDVDLMDVDAFPPPEPLPDKSVRKKTRPHPQTHHSPPSKRVQSKRPPDAEDTLVISINQSTSPIMATGSTLKKSKSLSNVSDLTGVNPEDVAPRGKSFSDALKSPPRVKPMLVRGKAVPSLNLTVLKPDK